MVRHPADELQRLQLAALVVLHEGFRQHVGSELVELVDVLSEFSFRTRDPGGVFTEFFKLYLIVFEDFE